MQFFFTHSVDRPFYFRCLALALLQCTENGLQVNRVLEVNRFLVSQHKLEFRKRNEHELVRRNAYSEFRTGGKWTRIASCESNCPYAFGASATAFRHNFTSNEKFLQKFLFEFQIRTTYVGLVLIICIWYTVVQFSCAVINISYVFFMFDIWVVNMISIECLRSINMIVWRICDHPLFLLQLEFYYFFHRGGDSVNFSYQLWCGYLFCIRKQHKKSGETSFRCSCSEWEVVVRTSENHRPQNKIKNFRDQFAWVSYARNRLGIFNPHRSNKKSEIANPDDSNEVPWIRRKSTFAESYRLTAIGHIITFRDSDLFRIDPKHFGVGYAAAIFHFIFTKRKNKTKYPIVAEHANERTNIFI